MKYGLQIRRETRAHEKIRVAWSTQYIKLLAY